MAIFSRQVENETNNVDVPSEVQNSKTHIFSFSFKLANLGSSSPTPDIDSAVVKTESAEKPCEGFNGIKIKGESSNGTGTVAVALKLKDVSGNWSFSEKRTPGKLGEQGDTVETNYFHLAELKFDLRGEVAYKIVQMGAPSDSAATSFWGDEV